MATRRYQPRNHHSSSSSSTSSHQSNLPNRTRERVSDQRQTHESNDASDLPAIVGTCPLMCPEAERSQRERLRDLAVFERLHGNPRLSSPSLAVKKFCRTISTKQVHSSDVRSLPVLEGTLKYLLNLLDTSDRPFEVIHDFVFDRTRSIRQDLSMQDDVSDRAIRMYQEIVKFHIISHYKLRNCSSEEASSLHYLNMEQLAKALTSLFSLYEANRRSDSAYENEAEFRSFYVLLHLRPNSQPMGESLSVWFRRIPLSVMRSENMIFARKILRYFRIGNYKRFLNTVAAQASYLQYCIIEPYVNEVRALALSFINNCGYKLHPYPLTYLSKLLMMKDSETESICNACGLETCTDEGGSKLLPTKQPTFCSPKGGLKSYSFLGLERFERNLICEERDNW